MLVLGLHVISTLGSHLIWDLKQPRLKRAMVAVTTAAALFLRFQGAAGVARALELIVDRESFGPHNADEFRTMCVAVVQCGRDDQLMLYNRGVGTMLFRYLPKCVGQSFSMRHAVLCALHHTFGQWSHPPVPLFGFRVFLPLLDDDVMPAVLALADVEVMPAVLRLVMVRGHTIAFATCATIVFTFVCDAVKTNPTNEDVQVRAGPGANTWLRVHD